MDKFIKSDDIVLLLDNYSSYSHNLRYSFHKAGLCCPTVVIEDDGFLPEDVLSVYGFFLGNFKGEKGVPGKPKYFNQITIPDYWEISGNNSMGRIKDVNRERGRIFYAEPLHKRLVKIVDWYDEKRVSRSSDHYNRYGALFARTIFNAKGQKVNKSWFSASGQEIIVENYVTGDIILNDSGQVRMFHGKTEFVLYVLKRAGFEKNRLFYNSLSTPFFVSQSIHSVHKRDVLFWQEPINGDIPGNMQIILKGEASRTARIMVQRKCACDALFGQEILPKTVHKLGFIYPFEKENHHMPEALICTNSDQIEHCRKIVDSIPEMHFHIAALTEMSTKLMSMDSCENVSLYPGVSRSILSELFRKCDFYLDINRENEIASAVYRAFLHNHMIFAFNETLHNSDYVAVEHCYALDDVNKMISDIRMLMADGDKLECWLRRQRDAALTETKDSYLQFLERKRKPIKESLPITMHITGLLASDDKTSHVIAQQNVVKLARELGFVELPLQHYPYPIEDGTDDKLTKQLSVTTSVIKDNDVVFFQSPSWNATAYDSELVDEIRRHRNIRLVIFIHDVPPMMFGATEEEFQQIIKIYNRADLVIVPTESMLDFLRKKGLAVKKALIQPMWDFPFSGDLRAPVFRRQILFSGSPDQFPFLASWNYDILLRLFTNDDFEFNGENIHYEGRKNTTELLTEYTKGGFGLVWEHRNQPDYDKCSQPYVLSTYLAAGIPVIMKKGLVHEQTIVDYEIGFVVDSIEEAVDKVKNCSEEEFTQLSANIKNISRLIRGGFFTKKILVDAINYLMLG